MTKTVSMQVWGPWALFTRPEHTAERLTYPVMTPSAAIGVLEAVYWKPEFGFVIDRIDILKRIQNISLRRNESSDIVTLADAVSGNRRVGTLGPHRVQRNAVCLKDVAYRIHACIERRPHADKPAQAYADQFRRRVARGQCFSRPYLGTREFGAYFSEPDDTPPLDFDANLGVMLHSIRYPEKTSIPTRQAGGVSTWFEAEVRHGVMQVASARKFLSAPENGEEA